MKLLTEKITQSVRTVFAQYEKSIDNESIHLMLNLVNLRTHCGPEELQRALLMHVTDPDRGRFAPKVCDVVHQLEKTTSSSANALDIFYSFASNQPVPEQHKPLLKKIAPYGTDEWTNFDRREAEQKFIKLVQLEADKKHASHILKKTNFLGKT